ncbi:furostanol glycoside 26-O-beta-glucosidase-like isoform X1 [Ricinus communis]|uniref:furostanol glycoside 26-O-beta-glucosidase-like isoform X1 n=1 Tax=Ricinus communis TaxID=3988 RepID=UPI00201AED7F|nr:furostanol glycoside 26-O-beta-glucosidase-like isoform X1 [Ricinus communis]XP_048228481.1 furostanol glycoside 26-O-beta-glucosidase-like isoform X1 [Ricinus communis]XP_048228482.1 furostanol glycoside 26-O-beta-glucosidase-like isoform X1 [Ricinus communis]
MTLNHFDFPQALEDKYVGFLSSSIVDDLKDYSEFCFKTFGDRVKSWITINEPLITAKLGYDLGSAPPGRCSEREECAAGESSTEPYIVIHNLLLAHATVARLYKQKYQWRTNMEFLYLTRFLNNITINWHKAHPQSAGRTRERNWISLTGQHYEPYSNSLDDIAAQERVMDFELGWYLEPLVYGDYPSITRELVKDRLPTFTEQEKVLVKGSFDFIGINYYTSNYAKSISIDQNATACRYTHDQFVNATC